MITWQLNLGEVLLSIIGTLTLVIGYLIKQDLKTFSARLDKHDEMLFGLVGDVQRLIGSLGKKTVTTRTVYRP